MKEAKFGNCYVTCEALYHLLGGKAAGWVPHTIRHEGAVHWYLVNRHAVERGPGMRLRRLVLDPTVEQFEAPPPYHLGRGRGFLTKEPSARARELMKKLLWQEAA